MRRLLNGVYATSLYLAGALIVGICLLLSAQVGLNFLTRSGFDFPSSIPSYAEISGYLLGAASFLALAPTLKSGNHIQISLFTQQLPIRFKKIQTVAVNSIGLIFSLYATYYFGLLVLESIEFGDKSIGTVKIDLWIPQAALLAGLVVLLIAFVDELFISILTCFDREG